jgi:hypothetical protein
VRPGCVVEVDVTTYLRSGLLDRFVGMQIDMFILDEGYLLDATNPNL